MLSLKQWHIWELKLFARHRIGKHNRIIKLVLAVTNLLENQPSLYGKDTIKLETNLPSLGWDGVRGVFLHGVQKSGMFVDLKITRKRHEEWELRSRGTCSSSGCNSITDCVSPRPAYSSTMEVIHHR